ncbi:MAG: amino acid permease [Bacteroidota bacterium]
MSTPKKEFKQSLGLLDSTMIVIGSMIGSGIFIVSADIARTVGSPGMLLIVWIITGFITLTAALSYGELAGMMPHAGGQYVYLREAYNPLIGFLYGWTVFTVIQTGTIAAVGVAFAKFTAVVFPWFSEQHILFTLLGFHISAAQLLAIASIVVLTAINLTGIKEGKVVQNIFTFAKTFALIAVIFLGIFIARNAEALSANFSHFWDANWTAVKDGSIITITPLAGWNLIAAIGVAMVGSLFSSDAWNNITFTAGEVINPKKNIPLSLAIGTGIVTLLYLLANIAYIVVLPVVGNPAAQDVLGRGIQFATSDRVGTATVSVIFGETAAVGMAILIMISTFGCNNGLILAGARVYYAMAKDKLFFSKAGELNSHAVPSWALIVQAVWASLLCLSGSYGDLLDYVIFAVLIFYILTVGGIFILRKKQPNAERPYKAIGYPVIPALYIGLATLICAILLIYKPTFTWPGLGIVATGVPVYFIWNFFTQKS